MCNMFYCESAFTEFICFNCHEIGLLAVVLRHHNMLTPASPFFHLFLRNPSTILLFFMIFLFSGSFFSPPLLDGKGVPQEPPHHVDPHPWAAHIGSAVTHLEKMGLHVVETGVKDQLKIRRVWHFWYKLILVHHL